MKIIYRIDHKGTAIGESPIENVVETLEIAAENTAEAHELFKQHIWDECDHSIWTEYEDDDDSITLFAADDMQRFVIVSAS